MNKIVFSCSSPVGEMWQQCLSQTLMLSLLQGWCLHANAWTCFTALSSVIYVFIAAIHNTSNNSKFPLMGPWTTSWTCCYFSRDVKPFSFVRQEKNGLHLKWRFKPITSDNALLSGAPNDCTMRSCPMYSCSCPCTAHFICSPHPSLLLLLNLHNHLSVVRVLRDMVNSS